MKSTEMLIATENTVYWRLVGWMSPILGLKIEAIRLPCEVNVLETLPLVYLGVSGTVFFNSWDEKRSILTANGQE